MSLRLGWWLICAVVAVSSTCCARRLSSTSFPWHQNERGLKAGENSGDEDFEYNASLRLPSMPNMDMQGGKSLAGQHYCAGALVAENVVLTAAHCAPVGWYPDVHLNRYLRDGPDNNRFEAFKVIKTVRHPKFVRRSDGLYDYDAAVLILDGESEFEPTAMQRSDYCSSANFCSLGKVLGWGWQEEGDFESGSREMVPVDVDIMGQKPCDALIQPPPEAVLCALEQTHACQVDSGGPLISDGYLKGIASSSAGCGEDPVGMYTKILKIVDWVDEQIEEVRNPATQLDFLGQDEEQVVGVEDNNADTNSLDSPDMSPSQEGGSLSGTPIPSSRTGLQSKDVGSARVGVKVPIPECRFIYGDWQPENCNG